MKSINNLTLLIILFVLTFVGKGFCQNPIIRDQFTADPTARVFNGKVFLYPSHDILAKEGKGRPGWFCMEDYHVFSSDNLIDWTDHGMIVSQTSVPWANPNAYSMWAPDCIERNGKYYFYFPTAPDSTYEKGFKIGVAVADNPSGKFIPQPKPIEGVNGIDPNVIIDNDGQAYLYWSARNIFVAKLKDNMLELDSEPKIIANLPTEGLKEGPFVFERNGIYYLTFPHVENNIERLEYAVGDSPMGPFKMAGVIMDESPMNCWTNHHSLINYNDQWYLFYHQNALSPKFDKNRSVCIDSLFFGADGKIKTVKPTLRGVGVSIATSEIQIDRYSEISESGVSVEFIDTLNVFAGWKVVFDTENSWLLYNAVNFGKGKNKKVYLKAKSELGGVVQIRLGNLNGTIIAEIDVPHRNEWEIFDTQLFDIKPGVQNVIIVSNSVTPIEIDWIKFN